MTFFTCISAFLCTTEIYDKFLRKTLLEAETSSEQSRRFEHDDYDEEVECNARPCLYELIFCGSLRNCIFRSEVPSLDQPINRKKGRCGVLTFTTLTFAFGLIMELSHLQSFSNASSTFQPHYMEDITLTDDVKNTIWKLNFAKTIIGCSYFTLSIVFRSSFYVFGVLVCLLLWPVLLIHYLISLDYEKRDDEVAKNKQKEEERRLQILQESPALSGRTSVRMNQVASLNSLREIEL